MIAKLRVRYHIHNVYSIYWTGFHACGPVCYHTELKVCCQGKLLDKLHRYTGCCGGATYNTVNETCCAGKIHEKQFQYLCCGSKLYNADKYLCCGKSK